MELFINERALKVESFFFFFNFLLVGWMGMEYKMSVLLKNTSLNHLSKLQNFPFLKMRHYLRGLYIAKLFNTLYYKKNRIEKKTHT